MRDDGDGEITYQDKVVRPDFSPSAIRDQLRQQFQPRKPAKEAPSPPPPPPPPAEDRTAADAAPSDKDDPLPEPGEAYRVHGRGGNKPELTLYFVMRDYDYEGFSYADLRRVRLVSAKKPRGGRVMVLRFGDTEVTLEGRNLKGLCNRIGRHRVAWTAPPAERRHVTARAWPGRQSGRLRRVGIEPKNLHASVQPFRHRLRSTCLLRQWRKE